MYSNRDLHWKNRWEFNFGFKSCLNQQILDCRDADSRCKFQRHDFSCYMKNGDLNGPFSEISKMISLKYPQKPEYSEQYYPVRVYDTLNNRHLLNSW